MVNYVRVPKSLKLDYQIVPTGLKYNYHRVTNCFLLSMYLYYVERTGSAFATDTNLIDFHPAEKVATDMLYCARRRMVSKICIFCKLLK